ncbi:hypothetical protein MSUIS_01460 [Mycoplasma suis KI3806]|uniref:Uncharacterized protein n=1 Tax=Mycoplasma suis (strain KI_3806) TaxID=708248 RepID=F0V317_MYCS3|nr:hypothetical protein [Mycoplasma suis]CBZ40239.1 hypothetical protein MSUIS_01460 [Mycoplasma suis KI3806]
MSFLIGAAKIAFLSLSIIGSTVGVGSGLSYTVKNKLAEKTRQKRNLDRQKELEDRKTKQLNDKLKSKDTPFQKKVFKAEAIFKKMSEDTYSCRDWENGIDNPYKDLEDSECKGKINKIWGTNSENKPERWFRSDPESAISFFRGSLSLTSDKYYLLRNQEKGEWETSTFTCNHKRDENQGEMIVVSCNKKASSYYRSR